MQSVSKDVDDDVPDVMCQVYLTWHSGELLWISPAPAHSCNTVYNGLDYLLLPTFTRRSSNSPENSDGHASKHRNLQPAEQEIMMFFGNRQMSPLLGHEHILALGPMPKLSLEIFVDLGLTDAEIGRYFKVPQTYITQLRKIWNTGTVVSNSLSGVPVV